MIAVTEMQEVAAVAADAPACAAEVFALAVEAAVALAEAAAIDGDGAGTEAVLGGIAAAPPAEVTCEAALAEKFRLA